VKDQIIDGFSQAEQGNKPGYAQIDQLCVQIHEKNHNQRRKEQADENCRKRIFQNAEPGKYQNVEYCIQAFYQGVAERNLCAAAVTFSAEPAPAENWYQITLSDWCAAGHAVGLIPPQGFIFGQAVNTHI